MNERTYVNGLKRVVSYARVSTGTQAASGLSIDAQHRAIAEASAARGWRVVECITDEAISGAVPADERRGLSAVLAQLDTGKFDMLVATRVDRLARDTLETLLLFERAERAGWELVTLDAPDGVKTHDGRMLVGILAVVAAHEAGSARARTIAALQTAQRNGKQLGRPSRQPEDARILATQLRGDGCSLREIATALEVAGILTATGKTTWHHSSVAALLKSTPSQDSQSD
ncbi:MAG: recombinase family protein [Acidimicrobiaceae bacterium]|nr:recombinase family protein [Acidimicrobiaceae bacterium]